MSYKLWVVSYRFGLKLDFITLEVFFNRKVRSLLSFSLSSFI